MNGVFELNRIALSDAYFTHFCFVVYKLAVRCLGNDDCPSKIGRELAWRVSDEAVSFWVVKNTYCILCKEKGGWVAYLFIPRINQRPNYNN